MIHTVVTSGPLVVVSSLIHYNSAWRRTRLRVLRVIRRGHCARERNVECSVFRTRCEEQTW